MKIGGSQDRREKDSPVGDPHFADHPPAVNHAASLEEDLQPKLDSPRDIALAAGMSKVGVRVIRPPELVHGAEENTVEDIARIGLEPHVSALTEVSVLEEGEVLVEVPKTADARIQAGSVTESKHVGIPP